MNTPQRPTDTTRGSLPVELLKLIGGSSAIALLVLALLYWGLGTTGSGALVIAALVAIATLGLLRLSERPANLTRKEAQLLNWLTLLFMWCWSTAAGFGVANYADAVAFKWLGFLVPPVLLAIYLWPKGRGLWWENKFAEEGSVSDFVRSIPDVEHPSSLSNDAVPTNIRFGGIPLPFERTRKLNFLVLGSIGSGKTTILKQMMRDVLPYVKPDGQFRAVIYDAKNDLLPFLDVYRCCGTPIHLLNPFDRRGYAWDIAADCQSVDDAESMAMALVPERTGSKSNEYFTEISRALTSNAILALSDTRGKEWGLLDVITTILDPSSRETLLQTTAEGRMCLRSLGRDETARDSLSTVYSFFYGLISLAMLMNHHAAEGRTVSIKDWRHSPSLLVLGGSDSPDSSLSALNRVLIECLQKMLLSFDLNPKNSQNRTILFLDEFADLGRLEAVRKLMRRGRDYGVCSVLAFQTVPDIQAAFRSDAEWRALLGQIGNKAFLRMNDDYTAKWAADQIGMCPVKPGKQITSSSNSFETRITESRGGPLSYDYVIHPGRFLALPIADGAGVSGFVKSGVSRIVPNFLMPWNDVIGFESNDDVPMSVPCPPSWQRLTDSEGEVIDTDDVNPSKQSGQNDELFQELLDSLKRTARKTKPSDKH